MTLNYDYARYVAISVLFSNTNISNYDIKESLKYIENVSNETIDVIVSLFYNYYNSGYIGVFSDYFESNSLGYNKKIIKELKQINIKKYDSLINILLIYLNKDNYISFINPLFPMLKQKNH